MNAHQIKIIELWKLLSEAQKKELRDHLGLDKLLLEKAGKFRDQTTMNFGSTSTCPTCGK